MKNVCNKCWNENCNCVDGYKIEIDDDILEEIIILNKKGYKTVQCCSGHEESELFSFYIWFSNNAPIYNVPKIFKIDRNKKIIRYIKQKDKLKHGEIEMVRKTLKKWVLELEDKAM